MADSIVLSSGKTLDTELTDINTAISALQTTVNNNFTSVQSSIAVVNKALAADQATDQSSIDALQTALTSVQSTLTAWMASKGSTASGSTASGSTASGSTASGSTASGSTAPFAITSLTISNNSDGTRTLWFHGSYPPAGPSAMPTGTYDYTLDGGKTWVSTQSKYGLDNGAWDTWVYGANINPGSYTIAMRVTADPTIIAVAPNNPYIISPNVAPTKVTYTPISFPAGVPDNFNVGQIVASGGTPQYPLVATTTSTAFKLISAGPSAWNVLVADSTQISAGTMSLNVTVATGSLSISDTFSVNVNAGNTLPTSDMTFTQTLTLTDAVSSGKVGTVTVSGQSGGTFIITSQSVPGDAPSGELPRFSISNAGDISVNTMLAPQTEVLSILWVNSNSLCQGTVSLSVAASSGPAESAIDSDTLSALMTKINADTSGQYAGATLTLASGTYTKEWLSPGALDGWNDNTFLWPMTFQGTAGQNMPIMALPYNNAKGMLEVFNASVNFKGIEVANANGLGWQGEPNQAGIKLNAGCAGNFSIDSCYIHNCDDGILGGDFGTNVTITNTELAKCGSATGFTHNCYIAPCASVTVNNVLSWGAVIGHCFKTRAAVGAITKLRAFDGPYGTASYLLDMPDGGNYTIDSCTFEKGVHASNAPCVHYGAENQSSHPVNTLVIKNCVFINNIAWDTATYGDGAFLNPVAIQLGLVSACKTYDVVLENCIFYGFADTQIIGKDANANVGTITQTGSQLLPIAQAPALDWSHPFEPTFTTSTSAPEPYIYGPFIGK